MGSGLIYAIIVVLWAIVLVPMWLRRHDAETESRSVDRFSSAMKILSRRSRERARSAGPRSVVVPLPAGSVADLDAPASGAEQPAYVKPTSRPVTIPAPVLQEPRPAPRSVPRPVSASTSRASAHHRRRRIILLTLAVVLVAAGTVFTLGYVGLWVPLAAFALTLGYLLLVSLNAASVRREAEARRREQVRSTRRDGVAQAASPWHETVVLGRSSMPVAGERVVESADAESGWRPTPVPVPTYVNAPAATVLPRELDRRHEGAWDAQSMLEQAAAVRADAVFDREWFESDFESTSAQEIAHEDAESYRPRRRAVNE